MAELRYLRHLSQKTGLGLNYLSKEEKISVLLRQLSEIFDGNMVFKGSTPISRIYLSKTGKARFSEDLDFDFISKSSFKDKIGQLSAIMKKVESFEIKRPRIQHRTVRFDCYFTNELGSKDRIMVDFDVGASVIRSSIEPKITLIEPVFVPSVSANLLVYSLEDLVARKLNALYNRSDGKDIYDLFYLLDLKPDKNKLYSGISLMLEDENIKLEPRKFIDNLAISVKRMSIRSRHIGNETNHYIPTGLRPDWNEIIKTLSEKIKAGLL